MADDFKAAWAKAMDTIAQEATDDRGATQPLAVRARQLFARLIEMVARLMSGAH